MIFDTIANAERYASLHPLFPKAFDFIRNTDLLALAPGRYPIVGEDLFVIVEQAPGRTREVAKLECHRKYIDIQLVLEGMDEMGWKALADCKNPVSEFKTEKDIQFLKMQRPPGSPHRPAHFAFSSRRMRMRHW